MQVDWQKSVYSFAWGFLKLTVGHCLHTSRTGLTNCCKDLKSTFRADLGSREVAGIVGCWYRLLTEVKGSIAGVERLLFSS